MEDELVTNEQDKWHFDKVKDSANKLKLELTDEEFKGFLKIRKSGKDMGWIMHQMSAYKLSFTDAFISYITA